MPTSEFAVTASESGVLVLTEAAQDALLANSEREQGRLAWGRIIDQILEWISSPELLAYPEIDPISPDLLRSAIDYAVVARDALQPPTEPSDVCRGARRREEACGRRGWNYQPQPCQRHPVLTDQGTGLPPPG